VRTGGPGDIHAGNRHPTPAYRAADAKSIEYGERTWIDGVAAQFVARKSRAINQPDADTGSREHNGRNAAGRSCPDDENIARHGS
jgi:hypothetical protein